MSTRNWHFYTNYTTKNIRNSTVLWEPYWHVLVEDFLHPDLLQLCNNQWPNMDIYANQNQPNTYNQHRKSYNPGVCDHKFWSEFYNNFVQSEDITNAIYSLEDLDKPKLAPNSCSLWEDTKGYSVSNHVDGTSIHVAWQCYLTNKLSLEPYGTSLTDVGGKIHKQIPYKQNLCWIMRNDAYSYHKCTTVHDPVVRLSLMFRSIFQTSKFYADE